MERSRIEWTDHTFNPWWGCTRVSPGCDNCYAQALDKRVGGQHWGPRARMRLMSAQYWKQPRKWAKKGAARVFCASMADVFDKRAPATERVKLWALIRETPELEWLLLTKRPQNMSRFLPCDWPLGNVRLGVTTENMEEVERRAPVLLKLPHRLAPFVSAEPLLESLDLSGYLGDVGWVIAGGESGPRFRTVQAGWLLSLRDQCLDAGVPFFFKQWGGRTPKAGGHELEGQAWRQFPARDRRQADDDHFSA
ncbi:MAG: DUF5131 family protein [Gammaproteobacteria bacterium]|nr:DUF5131 family protein [Gammaproteobacteria bacterium]